MRFARPFASSFCFCLIASVWPVVAWTQSPFVVTLQGPQAKTLGLKVVEVAGASQGSVSHPAQLKLPPSRHQVLAAPVAGLVTAIEVDPGNAVRRGQAVIRLRSTQAQALRSDMRAAISQQELAERNAQRDERLLAEGLIPRARLEQSQHDLRVARLNAGQQQRALSQALARTRPDVHGDLVLSAPLSGQVSELMVEVGQRVEEASPLLKIVNVEELLVELQVPPQQARGLKIGQVVRLADPSGGDQAQHEGRVSSVGATVDERTQSLIVRARIVQGPSGTLRPGQWLQAQLSHGGQGHLLPESALVTLPGSGGVGVFLDEGAGRHRLQPVQVIGRRDGEVHVSGLAGSVKAVTQGTAALKALLPASDVAVRP